MRKYECFGAIEKILSNCAFIRFQFKGLFSKPLMSVL